MKKLSAMVVTALLLAAPLTSHQEEASTKFRQGWSLFKGGSIDPSIAMFNEVLKQDAQHIEAYYWRGKAYLALGKYREAVSDFDHVIKLNPDFASAYVQRAEAKKQLQDAKGAEADLAQAGQKDEIYKVFASPKEEQREIQTEALGAPGARSNANVGKALEKLTERIKEKAALSGDTLEKIRYAREKLKGAFKETDKASALLDALGKVSGDVEPQSPLTPERAEQLSQSLKGIRQSLDNLNVQGNKGAEMTAGDYVNRGDVRYKKGDAKGAIEDYTKALDLNPKLEEAYVKRGVARGTKRDFDGEIADCTKAIELNPEDADAYNDRGAAYSYKNDWDGEIRDCTKAIELNPKHARAYYNRGSGRAHKDDYKGALSDWLKVVDLDPSTKAFLEPYIRDARRRLGGK